MTARRSRRTTDAGNARDATPDEARWEPIRAAYTATRAVRPLLGTIAATGLTMLSTILATAAHVDTAALARAMAWPSVAVAAVLGGLALTGLRLRHAPSAAGRAGLTGERFLVGREPPAGRRFDSGSWRRFPAHARREHGRRLRPS